MPASWFRARSTCGSGLATKSPASWKSDIEFSSEDCVRSRKLACGAALHLQCELAEDRRNQLAHGRVDTNPVLHHGVGEIPIHCVHQGVHHLVTTDAENSGAQNLFALCIHEHLHKPLGFTSFASARDLSHWHLADQNLVGCSPCLSLGHADTTQRRIGEEGVDWYSVADFAICAIQEIVGDDLVIVVCGVRKRSAPVAVA